MVCNMAGQSTNWFLVWFYCKLAHGFTLWFMSSINVGYIHNRSMTTLVSLAIQLYVCTREVGSNTEYIVFIDLPLLDLSVKQGSR